jgi:acyl-CoA reductase-like NAD-dependent aldehyde dehydrogenase
MKFDRLTAPYSSRHDDDEIRGYEPTAYDIAAQVDRAVKAGATLHYGGSVIEGPGAFFEPTILTNISRDNPAYFEEFFGPVAQVYLVKDAPRRHRPRRVP